MFEVSSGEESKLRAQRSAIRVLLVVVVTAGTALVSRPQAAAAEATSFVFAGSGYGHAVGMSQYGARAQAEAGRSTATILRSYYDGVSFATRDRESIRVLLESDNDVVMTSLEPFSARVGGTTVATSSSSYPYMRALAASDGTRLYRGAGKTGPWTLVHTTTAQTLRYVAGTSRLRLTYDGGAQRTFRGFIDVVRTSSTRVHAVNQLWVEEYLYGVVPWEMPSSWHQAALRAQAIVARSYAVNQKIRRRAQGSYYDICDTTSCQVYGGYGAENSNSNKAVDATAGRVLTHPDSGTTAQGVVLAVFSSSTGGSTENNTDGFGSSIQYPYLRSVPDPWSVAPAASNPYASWETSVSAATVANKVGLDSISSVRVSQRNASGSARTLTFTGVDGGVRTTVSRTGLWTRSNLGLRSIFIKRIFTPPFYDDDGSAHEADIVAIWREGLTGGCAERRFCPSLSLSRGQMASLLARARNLPAASSDYFTDDDGSIYEADINRLAAANITAGCGENLFCPGERVTRAQMMSFLANAFSSAMPAATATDYFDDDNGTTHESNINRAAAAGFTGGCGPARIFCPDAPVSRAQTASFLARVLALP